MEARRIRGEVAPRLASEGVVIVASILLAFWIDAWWDHRQARTSEVAILESIHGEVGENRLELDRLLLRSLPQDSVTPWLSALLITWTCDAADAAAPGWARHGGFDDLADRLSGGAPG